MGKFDGVLLASDFDDTLCGSSGVVSPENLSALAYFVGEGGTFTIATGRAWKTFAPYAKLVPIHAPVILSNGAQLYDFDRQEVLVDLPLVGEAANHLNELATAIPTLGVECYHGEDVYIHNPNDFTKRHVEKVKTDWTACDLLKMPTPWSKAVIQDEFEQLEAAQEWMVTHYGDQYEVIFSNRVLLECTAKGATKGGMVLRLADLLGIDHKDVYCAGDNQNDIPMLEVAAIPFAPENCSDAVRAWGPTIVRSCDDHAIAHIIEILDEKY